jgi:poly-gamma-glutamate synthesis protein (capsule biosynthesis protein)
VTVVMAGDVLMHDGLWEVARRHAERAGRGGMDFRPVFQPTRDLVSGADLAVCHMETPVAPPEGPFSSYPVFSVPPQTLAGVEAAGFDVCTTASNHSVDQGFEGVRRTLAELDRQGLEHTGTARSKRERDRLLHVDVEGIDVALLSYAYGTNGMPVDADKPWSVNLIDVAAIRQDARRARDEGADAVLVALHWGDEYQHEPSAYQLDVADAVTRIRDVDLVFGHHAHVVQPVRRVNGTWVAFGMGNFVAQQSTDVEGVYEGMIARFTLQPRAPGGGVDVRWAGYSPTYISRYDSAAPDMRVYDIGAALRDPSLSPALKAEMRAARDRVRAVVGTPPHRRRLSADSE